MRAARWRTNRASPGLANNPSPCTISLASETRRHRILHDEIRLHSGLQMTNSSALTLALVLSASAATSYRFGYKGTAIAAIMAACVFAVWPIRLKRGLAGREQWGKIRTKGRVHFVITHSVTFCAVFAVWLMAPSYVVDNHLPRYWALQLASLLCVGCVGGLWEWRTRERKYSE